MARSAGRFWLPMGDGLRGWLRRGERQGACGEPGTRPGLSCTWGAAGAPGLSSRSVLCAVCAGVGPPTVTAAQHSQALFLATSARPSWGAWHLLKVRRGPQPAHSSLGTGIPMTLAQALASQSQGDTALGPGTSQGWWSLPSALPGAVPALRHLCGQDELGSQRMASRQ